MSGHHAINFYWLVRLRWWAMIGQVVVILIARSVVGLKLPLVALSALVGVSVGINLVSAAWARRGGRVHPLAVPALTAVDVLLLTGLLYFTGG
ncbi:MAG: sensor histidine kinase, partial [Myxococcota bacterium]